jgi:hypothetical protein
MANAQARGDVGVTNARRRALAVRTHVDGGAS